MTVEEFLKTESAITVSVIAERMYKNKSAKTTLNNKLKNNDGRSFSEKDANLALDVLKELSISIKDLKIK